MRSDFKDTHGDPGAHVDDSRIRVRECDSGSEIVRERYGCVAFDTEAEPPTREYGWYDEETFALYDDCEAQQVGRQLAAIGAFDPEQQFSETLVELFKAATDTEEDIDE